MQSHKIPPILINNQFILNCSEKTKHFNDYFSQQCKLIINSSVLPNLTLFTDRKIDHVIIEHDEIIPLIRNLDPNKATGSDGISRKMLLLFHDSVILPLTIIFRNMLLTST